MTFKTKRREDSIIPEYFQNVKNIYLIAFITLNDVPRGGNLLKNFKKVIDRQTVNYPKFSSMSLKTY